jgi:mono/diheme cytochrome c family protein
MTLRKTEVVLLLLAAALLLLLGCEASARSPDGFRLPDGDVTRGREVVLEMKCPVCHRVEAPGMPAPTVDPPVPVVLGGEIRNVKTDGELVTSIINPSHRIVPALRSERVMSGNLSRMPDYGDVMTVRQMADVVAFLQSRYKVIRPGVPPK